MSVKSVLGAVVASALLSSSIQAQSSSASIGVIAGANMATFGGSDAGDVSNKLGMLGGISIVKPLSGALSLNVEALFSQKGAKSSEGGVEAKVKVNYLEVPVLLRYSMGSGTGAKPFVAGGASLAIKVGCKFEVSGAGASASADCSEGEEDLGDIKSFDLGLTVGGGVDFAAGKNTVTLGARYTYGLLDLTESTSIQNRAFSFFAGISMPFKK